MLGREPSLDVPDFGMVSAQRRIDLRGCEAQVQHELHGSFPGTARLGDPLEALASIASNDG